MNIVQVQDQLKNFSQDQLVREMQMPSGNAPQFLVLGEIMRRKQMQQDFAAQKAKGDQGTVAQDAIAAAGVPQGGIADMARAMAPSTDMTQNTGVQAMAAGGPVQKMAEGDLIVRGGKRYIKQDDGTYLSEDGRDRILTAGQSMARDTAAIGEGLSTLRDTLSSAAQPEPYAGPNPDFMTGDYTAEGILGLPTPHVSAVEPTTPPAPLFPPRKKVIAGEGRSLGPNSLARLAEDVGRVAQTEISVSPSGELVADVPPRSTTAEEDPMVAAARKSAEEAAAARTAAGIASSFKTPDQIAEAAAAAKAAQDAKRTTPPAPPAGPDGGTTTGGPAGAGGASGMSSYEQELMDAIGRREKAAEQDKWLALAQVGLNLMSSTQPTIGGALGEAGLKGVEAARSARDQYDKDRLELLGAMETSRMARAKLAASAARGSSSAGGLAGMKKKDYLTLLDKDIARLDEAIAGSALGIMTPEDELALGDMKKDRDRKLAYRDFLMYGDGASVGGDDGVPNMSDPED